MKNKKLTPGQKAVKHNKLMKNERARYEKLMKAHPGHKDFEKWKESYKKVMI